MKRLIAILAAVMMMTVAVSCGSAGKNGGQNDAKAPAKQEESVEPEASAEQEEAAPEEPTTKVCPFCKSEIPIDAVKCAHCTSDVGENTVTA